MKLKIFMERGKCSNVARQDGGLISLSVSCLVSKGAFNHNYMRWPNATPGSNTCTAQRMAGLFVCDAGKSDLHTFWHGPGTNQERTH